MAPARSVSERGRQPEQGHTHRTPRQPGERVAWGEEPQQNERAADFEKSRRKRYAACPVGAPAKPPFGFAGRGGAREQSESLPPGGMGDLSGADFAPTWWRRMDSNHRRQSQQIYSLSPLATWVLLHIQLGGRRWSWWTDSNPRPADYKSAALPAELHQHRSLPLSQRSLL